MEDCEKTISRDGKTTVYTCNGRIVAKCCKTDNVEYWYNADGKLHRDDGPATISYKDGQKTSESWYCDGRLHRDDGPAAIYYKNGQKAYEGWYRNGKRHRDDGPAEIWYENGQKTSEYWYRDDKSHRDDGPAVIYYENGQKTSESWYRNGRFGGDVLAYVWLADINDYMETYIPGRRINTLDAFRDAVKGPLALELMRPLPIPIRDAIYEHYCLQ